MKSLYKKISAVILAVVLVLPVLSQGFVAYANLNVNKIDNLSFNDFRDYKYVLQGEDIGKYDSLYLGIYKDLRDPKKLRESLYLGIKEEYNNYERPQGSKHISIGLKNGKDVYAPVIEYPDGKSFLEGVKKGVLNKYRARYEFVVAKVGNLYFQLFLKLSPYQRQDIMVKLALKESKDYDFKVICSSPNDSLFGRAEMDAKIMELFDKQPEVMKKLLEKPKPEYIFRDVWEFASRLKSGKIKFMKEVELIQEYGVGRAIVESEEGYVRCSIGAYDYVFHYKKK